MKNILSYTLVIIICFLFGWFGHDYYQKKNIPEPSTLSPALKDTIYQTITNSIVDTVKIIETIYIPKEVIRKVTKYDTVYLEKEQVQSKYTFNPEPFSIEALCYADCMVDSVGFSYYPNQRYFKDLRLKFYQEGYLNGQINYPGWKKWAYFGAGVVGTVAIYKTIGK